jgi:hypothetical protein
MAATSNGIFLKTTVEWTLAIDAACWGTQMPDTSSRTDKPLNSGQHLVVGYSCRQPLSYFLRCSVG